ncbi:MAG: AsmA-like C-terminal domain-containing protein [Alphaproteobacteria bacterium GM202ARS2]|nr:AsmA-like C-terminal domain-containing protein [Alphaproteobacteria bacterium GM202ARS2]
MKKRVYRGLLAAIGVPVAFVCFLFLSIKLFDGVPLGGLAPDVGAMVDELAPGYETSYGSVVLNVYGGDIVFDVHDVSLSSHDDSFVVSVPRVRVLFDIESALGGVWLARGAYVDGMHLQMSTHEAEVLLVQLLLRLVHSANDERGVATMHTIALGLFDSNLVIENVAAGYRLRTYIQELRFHHEPNSFGRGLLRGHVYAERCRGYRGESLPEASLSLRYELQADGQESEGRLFRFWLDKLQVQDMRACLPQGDDSFLAAGAVDDVTGSVTLRFDEQLTPQHLVVDVGGRVAHVQMPLYYGSRPMGTRGLNRPAFDSFAVQMEVDIAGRHARLQRGVIGLSEGGFVVVSGEVYRHEDHYRAPIQISFESVDFSTLDFLWPDGLGTNARDWVLKNIPRGYVDYAQMYLDMALSLGKTVDVRVEQFDGTLAFRSLEVSYLSGMPMAQAVDGVAYYDNTSMILAIASGRLLERVVLDGSRVSLLALDSEDEQAQVALRVEGPLEEVLAVLDHPPLHALEKLGFTGEATGSLSGRLSGRVFFDFPLLSDLSVEQLSVSAQGNAYRLRLQKGAEGIDVRGDGLALTLNEDKMLLEGNVLVGDMYVRGSYEERFGDDESYRRVYRGEGLLTPQDWQLLAQGAVDVTPWLDGYTGFSYHQTVGLDGESIIFAHLDLTDVGLRVPFLQWRKPAGKDASLSVEGRMGTQGESQGEEQGIFLNRVHFSSDDSEVIASLAQEEKEGAVVTRAVIRDGVIGDNDFDIMVRHAANDVSMFVRARALVLEPLADTLALLGRGEGEGDTNDDTGELSAQGTLGLRMQIARAMFGAENESWLRDAKADVQWTGAQLRSFKFLSHTVHDDTFYRHSWASVGRRDTTMHLRSDNVGSFLSTLGLYDGLSGGSMRLQGTREEDDQWIGDFSLRDWRLRDTPFLSRLSSLVSVSGLMNFLLLDTGVDFEEGYGVFDTKEGRLSVQDSFFWGDSLGVSLSGTVDFQDRRLEAAGTLLPSYTLNNFLGRIPVLGELAGSEESHFLGVPYRAEGILGDDVDFRVEAGESLAPPLLRGLWNLLPDVQSR